MFRKFGPKIAGVAILVVIASVLGVGSLGFAGFPEPPTGAEQVIGPPIDGVLTATFDGTNATVVIVGACKKTSLAFGPAALVTGGVAFANTTAADIEDTRLGAIAPAGCFSATGGEVLIITGVTKFNNTGTAIGADVSISVVQPK